MGCCVSSPHARRKYRDPADLDEVEVPLRYFGNFRPGSVFIPDDIDGLPSTHERETLASDPDPLLYEAEMDHGYAYRCLRPINGCCLLCPPLWAPLVAQYGLAAICAGFSCDEMFCWVRKEYATRRFFRVYANRIEFNEPRARCPFGYLGCGSWNSDTIVTNPFDRGAFGFRRVSALLSDKLCCIWPAYGGTVARQRCPCNGSPWNRLGDCGGWWCDEWLCGALFCSFRYEGLQDPDEVAAACSIALQAYFEGRAISPEDMEKCLVYWRGHISERGDPEERKRHVCCESYCSLPICQCNLCHRCTHPVRNNPYVHDEELNTVHAQKAYREYSESRDRQRELYDTFTGPVQYSTLCRACGCRRVFGRRGFFFCTEGCGLPQKEKDGPAPPVAFRDLDDENDASVILKAVLGDPPRDVVYTRFMYTTGESNEQELVTWQHNPGGVSQTLDVEVGNDAIDDASGDANEKEKNHAD